jgi:N6-L-threonylcarbamoyladenine synthase
MSDIVVTGEGRGARGESDRPSPLAPRPSTHILAIETSCDETAAAVVVDGRRLLSNVVATQIDLHRRFGGVFPEVASRQHVLAIQPVVAQALAEAGFDHASAMDAIAVTHGPGLAGSLLVGVNMAKGLAFATGKPLLPVNHLEGHIYSNWVEAPAPRLLATSFLWWC